MRKTIFTAALSCTLAAGTAQAQKLLYDSGETFVVPSQLTSTGKAILGSYDYNESTHVIKLYDENLKETKSVTLNLPVGVSESWTEEATVIPTGAKADSYSPDIYIHDADRSIDAASIKSIVALANAMNQYYGYDEDDSDWRKYTGFTDIDGRISCYGGGSVYYYLSNFFGKQYPTEYIALVDGHICTVRRSYSPVYNENEAQWEKVSEGHTYLRTPKLEELSYTDYDANIHFSGMEPYCSQTLFNDDNSWEFIVPVMEEQFIYHAPRVNGDSEDGVVLRREVEQFMNETALKVVNENGNDILTLEMSSIYNIFRLNNKVYVEGGYSDSNKYYSVIYCLDGKGNAIKTVHAASRPKLANVGDGVIDVNVGEEKGHVILTSMGGSLIDRKQTNGEAVIRLDTRHLPKGIYNVTLQREGHTIANEKVMVK